MIELVCAACGRTSVVKARGGRKCCDECKHLTAAQRRTLAKERFERETQEQARIAAMRRSADPFDLSWKSDKRLMAEIKLFHMTYGTYTAACRSGIIRSILIDKGFKEPEKMLEELEVE